MNPFLSVEIQKDLVLASASPRRKEILEKLGFEFEVIPSDVDENQIFQDDPAVNTMLLAELKAVGGQVVRPRKTIVAADTIVLCDGRVLGKPRDDDESAGMLSYLSGRMHEVITGIALISRPNKRIVEMERTKVYFRKLTSEEIAIYVNTGEPRDKAGGYAIQGYGSVLVDRIEGCYFNVVGLPVPRLFGMFRRLETM